MQELPTECFAGGSNPDEAKHLEGRAIKKFIYKPGRIIGIVSAPA